MNGNKQINLNIYTTYSTVTALVFLPSFLSRLLPLIYRVFVSLPNMARGQNNPVLLGLLCEDTVYKGNITLVALYCVMVNSVIHILVRRGRLQHGKIDEWVVSSEAKGFIYALNSYSASHDNSCTATL